MMLFLLLVNLVTLTFSLTPNEIPNPYEKPEECGRIGVEHSSICDINNFLSIDEKGNIEEYINSIKSCELAVVVIRKMSDTFVGSQTVTSAAKKFATYLHDLWGVGKKDINNGVLIFLSIENSSIYISVGKGVQKVLNDQTLKNIIDSIKPYLRLQQYGNAIIKAVIEIDRILKRISPISIPAKLKYILVNMLFSPPFWGSCFFLGTTASLFSRFTSPKSFSSLKCSSCNIPLYSSSNSITTHGNSLKGLLVREGSLNALATAATMNMNMPNQTNNANAMYLNDVVRPVQRGLSLRGCRHTLCYSCLSTYNSFNLEDVPYDKVIRCPSCFTRSGNRLKYSQDDYTNRIDQSIQNKMNSNTMNSNTMNSNTMNSNTMPSRQSHDSRLFGIPTPSTSTSYDPPSSINASDSKHYEFYNRPDARSLLQHLAKNSQSKTSEGNHQSNHQKTISRPLFGTSWLRTRDPTLGAPKIGASAHRQHIPNVRCSSRDEDDTFRDGRARARNGSSGWSGGGSNGGAGDSW